MALLVSVYKRLLPQCIIFLWNCSVLFILTLTEFSVPQMLKLEEVLHSYVFQKAV